jgi:hypothetical protein
MPNLFVLGLVNYIKLRSAPPTVELVPVSEDPTRPIRPRDYGPADGIPLSALGPLQGFTVTVPHLPAGMTIQNVSVTGQGVLIGIAGTNTSFSQ